MVLIDIHAHLDDLKDLDKVIERARQAGVKCVITSGFDIWSNRKALELAKKYDIINASLGLYPLDAAKTELKNNYEKRNPDLDVNKEILFIKNNQDNIIAIGEVGMDLKNGKDEAKQIKLFEKMIELAKKIDKPLIIHSRQAEKQVIDILEDKKCEKVVMHCFCGSEKLVKRAGDLGYYFSIPPIIVRNQSFQRIVQIVDLNQLLTETDSPYLSPFPGKRNEPAFIKETIKKISEIKKLSTEEVEEQIFDNFKKLCDI